MVKYFAAALVGGLSLLQVKLYALTFDLQMISDLAVYLGISNFIALISTLRLELQLPKSTSLSCLGSNTLCIAIISVCVAALTAFFVGALLDLRVEMLLLLALTMVSTAVLTMVRVYQGDFQYPQYAQVLLATLIVVNVLVFNDTRTLIEIVGASYMVLFILNVFYCLRCISYFSKIDSVITKRSLVNFIMENLSYVRYMLPAQSLNRGLVFVLPTAMSVTIFPQYAALFHYFTRFFRMPLTLISTPLSGFFYKNSADFKMGNYNTHFRYGFIFFLLSLLLVRGYGSLITEVFFSSDWLGHEKLMVPVYVFCFSQFFWAIFSYSVNISSSERRFFYLNVTQLLVVSAVLFGSLNYPEIYLFSFYAVCIALTVMNCVRVILLARNYLSPVVVREFLVTTFAAMGVSLV